jgi:4-amino-4-deoxy-L-arabinose transferase-like glycosyltransferase
MLSAAHIGILTAMEDALSGAARPDPAPESPAAPAEAPAARAPGAQWLSDLAEPPLAIVILLALGTLLFIVNLGGYPLYTKGEPREAVIVSDIVHGGGFILPLRAGVEIPSKPPLMHWLGAILSLLAGGVSEWTVRMPSALFAIGGMLACFCYVRRLFNSRVAFLSALILGTSVQYLQAGAGARVDMTLTFFMEIAFFEFILIAEGLTARRMTLYFALAMAVLAKGPVGLILPGLVALVWMAVVGRWDVLGEMRLRRGALLVALVAGGWYVAATAAGGTAFVHKQILAENLFRFLHDSAFHEGHAHPFYYMEGALLAGFMPWTPLLLVLIVQALRNPRPTDRRLTYLLTWFAVVLIFYNLPQSKRGIYLLALYPALAALLAIYLEEAARAPECAAQWLRRLRQLTAIAFLVTGASALAGLGLLAFAPHKLEALLKPFGITDYDFVPQLELAAAAHPFVAMALGAALIAIGLMAARDDDQVERLCAAVAGGIACLALVANLFVEPAVANALTLKPFTQQAMGLVGRHSVGYMGALNYDVAFYSGRNMPVISIWRDRRPDFLIAWREDFMRLPASVRAQFRALLLSHPTELDGSGGMVLLRCEPAPPGEPWMPGMPPPAGSGPPPGSSEPPQFNV